MLANFPNTFILKLSLLPFILWLAWSRVVRLNILMGLAKWLGYENDKELSTWNALFPVGAISSTCNKKPLRNNEQPEGQDTPVKRPLSVANVLLDAFDLFFNQRGLD